MHGPESFVRGGPALTFFFVSLFYFLVDDGREDPNSTKSGPSSMHQHNSIEMAFRWWADDGPTLNSVLVPL